MKKYLIIIFVFILALFSPSEVSAKSSIAQASAPGMSPSDATMGDIVLYDDYTIAFYYQYSVSDIVINVCKKGVCNTVEEAKNQTFIGDNVVQFDLSNMIVFSSQVSEYTVHATALFRRAEGLNFESIATLTTSVKLNDESPKNNNSNRVVTSAEEAIATINKIVLPGVYILLAIVLFVKAILLTIDLVKYSDYKDIRREKLRAFVYLFVGVVCVAIINSSVGFITGLFR